MEDDGWMKSVLFLISNDHRQRGKSSISNWKLWLSFKLMKSFMHDVNLVNILTDDI